MHARAFLATLPLACSAVYVSGCGHEHEATAPIGGLTDVVYVGAATDEALRDLIDAPTKSGDKRTRLTSPAAGAKLSTPPTFAWNFGPGPSGATDAGALGFALTLKTQRRERGLAGLLAVAFPGERQAFAHGEPLNGTAYLLVLATAADDKLLRVFTTQTTFTPNAAAWDKVKKAGASVRAVVTTGLFENNKLVSGGGPFEGEAISFDVSQ